MAYDLDSELILGCGVFALPTDVGTLGPMLATIHALTGARLAALLADGEICQPDRCRDLRAGRRDAVRRRGQRRAAGQVEGEVEIEVEGEVEIEVEVEVEARADPEVGVRLGPAAVESIAARRGTRCRWRRGWSEERAGGVVAYECYRCPA